MSPGNLKTRTRVPARNESTVRLSNARPKNPFRSPSANHSYLCEERFMSIPCRGDWTSGCKSVATRQAPPKEPAGRKDRPQILLDGIVVVGRKPEVLVMSTIKP